MKIVLSGKVTAINADGTPSIEIMQARINDLHHKWKLGSKVFIVVDIELKDLIVPAEIASK